MKCIRCEIEKEAQVCTIENSLESLQKEVGGLVEFVYWAQNVVLICNKEGKLDGLPLNRIWIDENEIVDVIAGNFLIVGCDAEGNCVSLSDSVIERILKQITLHSILM